MTADSWIRDGQRPGVVWGSGTLTVQRPAGPSTASTGQLGVPTTTLATVTRHPDPASSVLSKGLDTQREIRRDALARLDARRRPSIPSVRVHGMEKWEGRITEVDESLFTAQLTSLSHDETPIVEADFELSLLEPDTDVAIGDLIYVTVRTVRGHFGSPSRTVAIRRRRLGRWAEEELADAAKRAKKLANELADFIE